MKKMLITGVLSLALSAYVLAGENQEKKVIEIGQQASKKLLKTLVGKLQKAMKEGGPYKAIDVCSQKALKLTEKISKEEGVDIKRTTFKYRNPKNAPDKYEKEALEYFEKMFKEKGKLPDYYVQKVENGYRYYMPLKVKSLCLTCHGEPQKMDKKLLEKIKSIYKTDKATGYKEGDFRGVIRVFIPEEKLSEK